MTFLLHVASLYGFDKVLATFYYRTLQNSGNLMKKIAFIQSCWHKDIVDQARKSFVSEMEQTDFSDATIDFFDVSGSLEIPLQAKLLAESGDYDIIVCAGLIVNGGIYRHEFVAQAVIDGMMRVQLDTSIPVLSIVLTPQDFSEGGEREKFFFDHFTVKGKEAAEACVQTLHNMKK